MKRSTRIIVSLTAAAALAACEGSPTEPVSRTRSAFPGQRPEPATHLLEASETSASRSTYEWVTNLSGDYWRIACPDSPQDDELIRLEGEIVHRLSLLDDGAGGFHVLYRSRGKGLRGVGVDSGEEFRAQFREQLGSNQTALASTDIFREVRRLAGTASGRAFRMVLGGHFTVNANGELVVHMFDAQYECSL